MSGGPAARCRRCRQGATRSHAETERDLQAAGVRFTSLRNGFYATSAIWLLRPALHIGELILPEDGPGPDPALRLRAGAPERLARAAGTQAVAAPLSYHLCYREFVAQREKRSISLPPELARAVEEAARAEGTTFSAWLAQTAAHRLKLEAGRQALAEWERENGPLTEAELAEGRARARSSLGRTSADVAERKSA